MAVTLHLDNLLKSCAGIYDQPYYWGEEDAYNNAEDIGLQDGQLVVFSDLSYSPDAFLLCWRARATGAMKKCHARYYTRWMLSTYGGEDSDLVRLIESFMAAKNLVPKVRSFSVMRPSIPGYKIAGISKADGHGDYAASTTSAVIPTIPATTSGGTRPVDLHSDCLTHLRDEFNDVLGSDYFWGHLSNLEESGVRLQMDQALLCSDYSGKGFLTIYYRDTDVTYCVHVSYNSHFEIKDGPQCLSPLRAYSLRGLLNLFATKARVLFVSKGAAAVPTADAIPDSSDDYDSDDESEGAAAKKSHHRSTTKKSSAAATTATTTSSSTSSNSGGKKTSKSKTKASATAKLPTSSSDTEDDTDIVELSQFTSSGTKFGIYINAGKMIKEAQMVTEKTPPGTKKTTVTVKGGATLAPKSEASSKVVKKKKSPTGTETKTLSSTSISAPTVKKMKKPSGKVCDGASGSSSTIATTAAKKRSATPEASSAAVCIPTAEKKRKTTKSKNSRSSSDATVPLGTTTTTTTNTTTKGKKLKLKKKKSATAATTTTASSHVVTSVAEQPAAVTAADLPNMMLQLQQLQMMMARFIGDNGEAAAPSDSSAPSGGRTENDTKED